MRLIGLDSLDYPAQQEQLWWLETQIGNVIGSVDPVKKAQPTYYGSLVTQKYTYFFFSKSSSYQNFNHEL